MKNKRMLVLTIVLAIPTLPSSVVFAEKPSVKINDSGLNESLLWFNHGHNGNYYQFERSTDLNSWNNLGEYFMKSETPLVFSFSKDKPQEFFRAKCFASAGNFTYSTLCAENDNVMIFFRGDVNEFSVTATHPTYTVTDYVLRDDFTNCLPWAHTYPSYPFTYREKKIIDGGDWDDTVWTYRGESFWRPQGMTVTVDGNLVTMETNVHYMYLARRISGASEWPTFFVLYSDGNMRLIAFPPVGHDKVSMGTSVIIGPTELALSTDGLETRPVCDIESIDYRSATMTMLVKYRRGGTAILDVNDVTRQHAVVKVTVDYDTDLPFCTVRSNYVSNEKCDTSTVIWKDLENVDHTDSVTSFNGTVGKSWFLTRPTPSITRNSGPDMTITVP